MADLVAGAVVGAVVGELLKALLDAKDSAVNFKSDFERLQCTLEYVIPLVSEIERLNDELDRPRSETQRLILKLDEGKGIVRECSKVQWWEYYRKYRYSKKILKLDQSLQRFFNVELRVGEARDVKQLLVEMQEASRKLDRLCERSSSGGGSWCGFEGWCAAPELPNLTVGLEVPLGDLKSLMVRRDGVSLLVLSGAGGCGKTTLASKFCQDEEVKGMFKENIFFVTVSNAPNLKGIVQGLFQQMGFEVPEFQDDESAISGLGKLLRQCKNQKPVLLVLDDVWKDSGLLLLNKLLEPPLPGDCKILVTSRFDFPTLGWTYRMELLNDKDAMTLFEHLAFPEDDENSNKLDEDLVQKIVSYCEGLPLALVTIAYSLRRQSKVVWQNTEKKWSEGQSIFDSDPTHHLLNRLEISLDFLDDSVKECFLDLGLFLEDQRIPFSALLDMWIELYKLDQDDAYVNLLELYSRNLVNLVVSTGKDVTEIDGYYNELFVVQHDLLRELAIYRSSQQSIEQRERIFTKGNKFPECWKENGKQPLSARLLSIYTDSTISSSWNEMELPTVEVLILNFQTGNYKLPQFMEKMTKLKVLIMTNCGLYPAELKNFSWLNSLTNLRRIRLEKVSIPSLEKISATQMKNLQKISLIMCEVGQALRNCSIELSRALPKLVEIEIDYCNDLEELPVGLLNIIWLKKLSITNCHKLHALPEEIGKMKNLEVLRLHACTGLSELPDSIGSLSKLTFLDISYCLSIVKLPNGMGELCSLKKIDMRGCSSLDELPRTVANLMQLKHVICDEEIAELWKCFQTHIRKVKVPKEINNLDWLQI
ncbi:probable disease resistance protein At5g66900 [Malania oleifera]|uniref:probable disease resistance protein At5g66900 n=1 Tax=Malania oleifera TaxID=397392 RepID=UPI0025ADDF0B|nr:probable disease resistance protein At5g66900 [Malania oleifera]